MLSIFFISEIIGPSEYLADGIKINTGVSH